MSTEPPINSDLLEARLDKLSGGPAIERIRARLQGADDRRLFRVNPYTFAAEEGVAPERAVELFLRAAALGLFRAEWLLVCRGCGEYVLTHAGLRDLEAVVHCVTCARSRDANLDESVEVAFTVHPDIRQIRYANPASLTPEDYFTSYALCPSILVRGEGRSLVEHVRLGAKVMTRLAAGASHTFDVELEVGWIVGSPRMMITVEGEPTSELREVTLRLEGTAFTPRPKLAPGPARVTLVNGTDRDTFVLSYFTPIVTYFDYLPFLSGQRLLNSPEFRRHLGTEVVRPGSAIPTRDNTLLFSDLRGSTALYDHVGDVAAFELVSTHLERLARVITRHSGVVVKTIGDAVMASFTRPVDAVRAAFEMGGELQGLGDEGQLALKIGIHRGPCLVVNVRDEIDYFGQTVNIAARVQGLAKSGEVCLTDAVLEGAEVAQVVAEDRQAAHPGSAASPLPSESVGLRGVGTPCVVHRLGG